MLHISWKTPEVPEYNAEIHNPERVFALLCYRGIHYAKWVCIDVIMESPSWFISNPRKEDDQETD